MLAAASSLGAAAIHLVVIPEHAAEYPPAGVFFAALAVFQLAWAGAIMWRSNVRIAIAGLVVNAATIGIWVWSRTLGFPLGAEPGAVEPVGYQDTLATVLELGLVIVVGLLVWETWRSPIARLKISEADAFVGTGLGISAIAIFYRCRVPRRRTLIRGLRSHLVTAAADRLASVPAASIVRRETAARASISPGSTLSDSIRWNLSPQRSACSLAPMSTS